MRFNDVLDRKERFFFTIKTKFFNVSKIQFFQKGCPMLLAKKNGIFSLFVFAQNKIRSKV